MIMMRMKKITTLEVVVLEELVDNLQKIKTKKPKIRSNNLIIEEEIMRIQIVDFVADQTKSSMKNL